MRIVSIRADISERIDELLSPTEQRAVARAWSTQPGESVEWAIDSVERLLAADPRLAHSHARLPLPMRPPPSRTQRLVEWLTRGSRREYRHVAAMALQAAALAFTAREHISPRVFDLLTAGYAALGVPHAQVDVMLKLQAALRDEVRPAA